MTQKLFVDTHCHFFSVQHTPLTQTLQRVQKNMLGTTLKQVKAGAILTVASPLFPFAGFVAKELIDKAIPFIRFFDTDAAYSIDKALISLLEIPDLDIDERLKIFTPLTMDFEMCVDYKPLKDQVDDMRENIKGLGDRLEQDKCLILPFIGIDARRFDLPEADDDVAAELDNIINNNLNGELKRFTMDNVATNAKNGDFIGIKLYPSLGFDLWPNTKVPMYNEQRHRNIELMNALDNKQAPVTAHCQTDSYECGKLSIDSKTLINYAKPDKWFKLLEKSNANNIRLNLAHFGGEVGVSDMFSWWEEDDDEGQDEMFECLGLSGSKTWTYWIIKIIKKYKNVYSDIGAFNFEDEKAAASLLWLIHLDSTNKLNIDGEYKIIDKLMWGTDIPMTLFENKNYAEQFSKFYKNTNLVGMDDDGSFLYGLPSVTSESISDHKAFLEKLVNTNPANFLFGV